jgi:hypothetical protein
VIDRYTSRGVDRAATTSSTTSSSPSCMSTSSGCAATPAAAGSNRGFAAREHEDHAEHQTDGRGVESDEHREQADGDGARRVDARHQPAAVGPIREHAGDDTEARNGMPRATWVPATRIGERVSWTASNGNATSAMPSPR